MRQIGLPSTVVEAMARAYCQLGNARMAVVGDLVVKAFFFLLRVGKYTPHPAPAERCTIPLRKGDVKLWGGTQCLDGNAKWGILATANAATITLENQKNGQKGYTLHHHKTANLKMCPVTALARLVYAI